MERDVVSWGSMADATGGAVCGVGGAPALRVRGACAKPPRVALVDSLHPGLLQGTRFAGSGEMRAVRVMRAYFDPFRVG